MEIMRELVIFSMLLFFASSVRSCGSARYPPVNGHNATMCPKYKFTTENFDINRFLGSWHVIQNSDYDPKRVLGNFSNPDGDCYGYYYSQNSGKYSMKILNSPRAQTLYPYASMQAYSSSGLYNGIYMNFTNINMNATSRIMTFNASIIDDTNLRTAVGEQVILDTDYNNYAVVMTCMSYDEHASYPTNPDIPLVTAAILYRKNNPNWQQIGRLRDDILNSYTLINGNDLRNVSHFKCTLPDPLRPWPSLSTWQSDAVKTGVQVGFSVMMSGMS